MFKFIDRLSEEDKVKLRAKREEFNKAVLLWRPVNVKPNRSNEKYSHVVIFQKDSEGKNYILAYVKNIEFRHEYGTPLYDYSYIVDKAFLKGIIEDDYDKYLLDAGHDIYITKEEAVAIAKDIESYCKDNDIELPMYYNEALYKFFNDPENADVKEALVTGKLGTKEMEGKLFNALMQTNTLNNEDKEDVE